MSGIGYVILAYTVGLGVLWGYAATLWLRSGARRNAGGRSS